MSSSPLGNGNGNGKAGHGPVPPLSLDRPARAGKLDSGHSGRWLVIGAVLIVLAIWGGLYLVFRQWRAGYVARARFSTAMVLPALEPLGEIQPPQVPPEVWTQAVAQTHTMVERVVRSGLLDRAKTEALRVEIETRVARARAHPELAVRELIGLWDHMLARSGPVLAGMPYPPMLTPAIAAGPLLDEKKTPPDLDQATWRLAVNDTRVMLVELAASGRLSAKELNELSNDIATRAQNASAATARTALAEVWERGASKLPQEKRPELPQVLEIPPRDGDHP